MFKMGSLTATFNDWMSSDYVKAGLTAGAGLFAEETVTAMLLHTFKPSGVKATILKALGRLGMSALYYWLGRKYGKPTLGVVASIGPIAMEFVDLITSLLKINPYSAGASLAAKLAGWKSTATASAGVTSVRVVVPPSTGASTPSTGTGSWPVVA